ncbi:hypothetical protein E5082_16875 [Streptomyces griseoluteus]|uniref:Uncharacterized protein n=1 Tax=Streptomyces griseoluteus TaxID=29306 RepID=A0A4Z1DM47_STRGP|nr:hypothetical protein [Streptomyces griseoluteus]TGN83241.1 hypothetical protein E5082_16875 [Streptomyces griseoluteus]GHF19159.1 hypothetical protein GCM10017776_41290 [Streptomyces griseoluteus]
MSTEYRRALRDRYLAAPVMPAPSPWRPVGEGLVGVGGLLGIGFAVHPETGHDLVMVVSSSGHGLFDAVTGERLARDHDPDPETDTPDLSPDLTCPGLGPVAGTPIRIAGLFGGGLHSGSGTGWTMSVVSPDWPHARVLLSADGGVNAGPPGGTWWHIFHSTYSEFRAAGFSPTGRTLAVATSSDLALWTGGGHGRG